MAPKTSSSRFVLPRGVAGTEPSNAEAGTLSFDSATDTLRIKLSSGWQDFTAGGGGTGDLTEVQAGSGILVTSGTGPIPTVAADFGTGASQVPTTASVASAASAASAAQSTADTATTNLSNHTGNVSNPHATTKAQVGLGNVTNDPQWASTLSAQMSALSAKTVVIGTDIVPIEDSAAGFAKKKVALSDLASFVSAASFSVSAEIAPLHWWKASGTVQSGGLVDQVTDVGSSPKHFTQTLTARAPTATDGNGKTYLALDGTADYYTAGVASDWTFLNNGSAWTIALIYHRTAPITAEEVLLDTTNDTSASTGMYVSVQFSSATSQGPFCAITNGTAGAAPVGAGSLLLDTALTVLIIRHQGSTNGNPATSGVTSRGIDIDMRRRGTVAANNVKTAANAFNTSAPLSPLTLGRRSNTSALFSAARMYEIVVDSKCWSDRQAVGFESYARATYAVSI